MKTRISVENGDVQAALQGFLRSLLESGVVDALLVPMVTPSGTVTPALVSDPDILSAADLLAPVLPVNAATLAGKLSAHKPRPKVGVVLRACELRALVELTKMQQASLDDLTLIALDCAGTVSVPGYRQQQNGSSGGGPGLARDLFASFAQNPASPPDNLRAACQVCEQPVYEGAAISIELLGSDLDKEVRLSVDDELASRLGLKPVTEDCQRVPLVEALVAARTQRRDAEFAALRQRLESEEGITGVMADCIRCHNCMNVCPICYCKTCVFKSAVFDHEPMQITHWAQQKGAFRLPADTMLFHLTRLNHMALSCVGCGMCTEACPADLPVGMVFRAIGQRVQTTFDYTPGRSLEDPLPLVTFKADEWQQVGE